LLFCFTRLAEPRVDLRDGCPFESSSLKEERDEPPFFKLRVPLDPSPARRSVALTPGRAVFTPTSRRGRGGLLGRFGFDLSI